MSVEDYGRASDIQTIRGTKVVKGRALSNEEIKQLFDSIDTSTLIGKRNRAMLAVLYLGGLRRSEIVGLKIKDFANNELKIHGKGNKERIVPLGEDAVQAINDWIAQRGDRDQDGPLFLAINRHGEMRFHPMTDQAVLYILQNLAAKAHVKHFSPHDMRRTYISDLLDVGNDIVTVQHLAGHSNVTTTAKYDRRGEAAKQKAAQTLHIPTNNSQEEQQSS